MIASVHVHLQTGQCATRERRPSLRVRNDLHGVVVDPALELGVGRAGGSDEMITAMADAAANRSDREWMLTQRIRAEYEEMPGLALTLPQAVRLWGEDPRELEALLAALVREGFLMWHPRGTYRRNGCPRCS